MAGRSVDVSLRIKAQDEASKALEAVGKALKDLAGAQGALAGGSSGVGKFVESLSRNVDGLSALFKKLDTTLESTGRAYTAQAQQLASVNASIEQRKRRIEELTKAELDLQRIQGSFKPVSPAKQATFVGPVPPKITQVRSLLSSENNSLAKEQASLERLIGRLAEARIANQQIREVQGQVAGAINSTTAAFIEQANALDRLAESEKRAAREAVVRQQGAALRARVEATTGITGTRAIDNGATFSALAAREEADALKAAADAHAAFEARVKQGAKAMREEEAAAAQLAAEVDEMRRDFDRAGYAQAFLERETKKLDKAVKLGILSQNQYEKALESVRRKSEQLGETTNPSILGLNPYQTQNLLFQFNDIATQLASGTSLTQTLAQQGGQIIQLFPRVGNAIVGAFAGALPYIGAVAAALGGIVIGISRAADNAQRLRTFDAILLSNADAAQYSSQQLGAVAKNIQRLGIESDEAMKIIQQAIQRGLSQDSIETFAKSAKGLALILGTDVAGAAVELQDALRGGYDAIADLDDKTNLLTASERNLIRELFEQGKATEAASLATRLFNERLGDTANKAEGPWATAIRELKTAWNELLDALANSVPIQAAVNGLTRIAQFAAAAINTISGVETLADKQVRLQEIVLREYGGLRNRATATPNGYVARPGFERDGTTQRQIEEANRLQREISAEQAKANDALINAQETATKQATERVKKADDEVRAASERLATEKKITSEADVRAAIEAKRKELLLQAQRNPDFRGASDAAINGFVDRQLNDYRISVEEKLTSYRKQQADQAEREAKARLTMQAQAASLLRNVEGFRSKAYYDVNAYRAGFGSDTVTRADGTVQRVNANTTVTRADAERDLARRIEEFANVIKQQIGSDRFGQFNASQQAALVSIAYNYGELPKRIIGAVKEGTNAEIAAAVRGLAGDNGGINASRRNREAAILATENLAVTQGAEQAAADAQAKIDKYNISLDDKLSKEERSIANQRELIGLQGEELRAAIERQQVAEAIAQATDDLRRATGNEAATLSQDQVNRITVDVKARLKLDEPAKVAADLQKQVDDLQNFRGALETKLQERQSRGDVGGMREVQQQIDEIDAKIAQAAKSYLDFLNTPGNAEALGLYGAALDTVIAKMTILSEKTAEWQLRIGSATISASEFANAFTNSATNALDNFAQAVANGANGFKSLGDAFRQFAADFLLQIAKMIQQQIIFNLVSGLLRSIGGGLGGLGGVGGTANGFGAVGGIQAHGGGVVGFPSSYGSGTGFRSISPALFAAATRYHSGGIAGLKPGEVPSILMRGEEVLTRDDPRHVLNGGGGSGSVKIVNAFDHGDVISKALETKAGEKAVLNLVRSNPRAFRAAMGNG